jgi:hypothetical protein
MFRQFIPHLTPMKSTFPALRYALPVLFAGMVLTSGCGTWVTVNSVAKPGADTISYQLHNANPGLSDDTVGYNKAADYVRTALSGRGMFEAPRGVKPDVVMDVEFGVSPPQNRSVVRSEPIYRDTYARVPVSADAYGNPVYGSGGVSGSEVSGYRDRVVTTVVYEKYLRLVARAASPAAAGLPPEDIWVVDAKCEGESRDLRKYLPLLVAASIDYIGKDSQGPVRIRIKDQDVDVTFVKNGRAAVAASPK